MENPNPNDVSSSAPVLGPQMPPAVPQLPPQMFTTAASLLDLTDKKLMVALRDGKKLIGVMRSFDQFGKNQLRYAKNNEHPSDVEVAGNIVLQDTIERIFVKDLYADIDRGIFLIRGENILLLGEIDLDKDDYIPPPFKKAPVEEVFLLKKRELEETKRTDKVKQRKLAALGFEAEQSGEAIL
ncbi:hypothetical protein LTR66_013294 [Elasticomyces elasticus]|nr:hypothetical protein LTR66_013294 [Elasticomyces elasticus]